MAGMRHKNLGGGVNFSHGKSPDDINPLWLEPPATNASHHLSMRCHNPAPAAALARSRTTDSSNAIGVSMNISGRMVAFVARGLSVHQSGRFCRPLHGMHGNLLHGCNDRKAISDKP